MKWHKELPKNCPPDEAYAPKATYFRLGSIPLDESDFWSHRKKFPHKKFHVTECIARSLSVFDEYEAAIHLKNLLPSMRLNMKMTLDIVETLIWHDFPQLFVAKDKIGGLQLCLAVDDEPQYISVAISAERLQNLRQRKIDLHSVFAQPELGSWFNVILNDEEVLAEATSEPLPVAWLPMPNVFLPNTTRLRAESFEMVKVAAVAKEAGMNATLLRQYLSGIKQPSVEQALRVQNALHRVAQRLLEVRFV